MRYGMAQVVRSFSLHSLPDHPQTLHLSEGAKLLQIDRPRVNASGELRLWALVDSSPYAPLQSRVFEVVSGNISRSTAFWDDTVYVGSVDHWHVFERMG